MIALFCLLPPSAHPYGATETLSNVPFVGCASDGQVGPRDAPAGTPREVPIPSGLASELAYYKAEDGFGVLAPRGWNCFETYGSNGETLYVSPEPINAGKVFSNDWKGFDGPVVQLTGEYGGTSDRFGVARTIAKVFPAHRSFARSVIREGIEPATSFPFGPYRNDKLRYKGNDVVEYQTPRNTEGLGTNSRLRKSDRRIDGVAILVGPSSDPNLIFLAVKLPATSLNLSQAMIQQVERDVPGSSR